MKPKAKVSREQAMWNTILSGKKLPPIELTFHHPSEINRHKHKPGLIKCDRCGEKGEYSVNVFTINWARLSYCENCYKELIGSGKYHYLGANIIKEEN